MDAFKTCLMCGQSKPLDAFGVSGGKIWRKTDDAKRHSYCRSCCAERAREFRKKNKNYRGTGRLGKVPAEDRALMSMIRQRVTDAKTRTKKYGLPDFTVTEDQLYQLYKATKGRCVLLGYEMVLERKHPLAPSLDQKDPAKGYIEGNVQWVCWAANRAKGDLTLDDFYTMCELALEERKVQRLSKAAA